MQDILYWKRENYETKSQIFDIEKNENHGGKHGMITGAIKNKVDKIWTDIWAPIL